MLSHNTNYLKAGLSYKYRTNMQVRFIELIMREQIKR